MKPVHKHLLAVVLASLAAAAMAQPAPGAGPGAPPAPMMGQDGHGDWGKMRERMQERMARRMAEFKQRLQITPAQEGAWTAFAAAMQPPAQPPQRPDRAEFERLTTPERIDRMQALRAQRNAEMDRRAQATKTFYAQLSPEQKKVFDQETLHLWHRRGHFGRHHRG